MSILTILSFFLIWVFLSLFWPLLVNFCLFWWFGFCSIEQIWRDFWSKDVFSDGQAKSEEHNKENEVSTSDHQEQSTLQIKKDRGSAATLNTANVKRQKIPVEDLAGVLQNADLQNFVQEADYAVYQYIVNILLPKVFFHVWPLNWSILQSILQSGIYFYRFAHLFRNLLSFVGVCSV